MFYIKIQHRLKIKKQKKRKISIINKKRDFQNKPLIILKKDGGALELYTYKKILRRYRRWSRKKKYRIFFKFTPNYTFSMKNKNSRMGKGKGKFRRFLVKFNKYDTVMQVYGLSNLRFLRFFIKMSTFFKNLFVIRTASFNNKEPFLYHKLVNEKK